jgi:hypothetical protein
VDLSYVVPIASFNGDDPEDGRLCDELFRRALDYVDAFAWSTGVQEVYVGHCVGGIIALVLVRITPSREDVDDWIWVIVGDVPSAYLAPADPRPREALRTYIHQMRRWVKAVRAGESVTNLIPVNAPENPESADRLDTRLGYLEAEILPEVR